MTIKGEDSEVISKKALDWLTGVSAIATILTTLLGFLGGSQIQLWAFISAVILALISSGVYFYQRRRAAKLKIAESQEPLSSSAALRGLLPFEEGDELPGRGRDVQDLYTLVSSSTFRFGVLWGESGCGKTSLLRAGLVPRLRKENFLPLYIHKPTHDPQDAIRAALVKELGASTKKSEKDLKSQLKAAAPKGKKVIILFDQFEEFFLTNRTPSSRAGFIKWLGGIVNDDNLPIVFLIGIRGDFFVQLQNFSPEISEPTSTRSTYQLHNFDTEQAKQILSVAAKADGIQFEPELIQSVIKELEAEDFVRPAELQVVGTRLKRKNITRLSQYEVLGGARGILSSYIKDEIKQSANEQAARLVLRVMCTDAIETKSPIDLDVDDILRGVSGSDEAGQIQSNTKQEEIQKILNQFVAARVLIRTEESKYNLAHDYLAPYVRTATEGAETNIERANRMLKRYVAEYKDDPKTRIPFGRIRLIQKYASAEVKGKDKAEALIKKSQHAFYALVAALAMPLIILLGLYFFYLTQAYYFSLDADSYIVLRTGSPQFDYLPGFGRVVIQTDFTSADLKDQERTRDEILQGNVYGFWFQKADSTKGAYQLWGEQLRTQLSLASQVRALTLLEDAGVAMKVILANLTGPQEDEYSRSKATAGLVQLLQAKPELVTPDMLQALLVIVIDPQADASSGYFATDALGQLLQAKPEFVTADMLQALLVIIKDPQANTSLRSDATAALGQLGQAKPEFITKDMLFSTLLIVIDSQIGATLSYDARVALGRLGQAKPEFVTPDMLQFLLEMVEGKVVGATTALSQLGQAKPELVIPDMLQSLLMISIDAQTGPDFRYYVTAALVQLGQARPELVTTDMLQSLLVIVIDPQADANSHYHATVALVQLSQAKPEFLTEEIQQSMITLCKADKDSFGRQTATQLLFAIAISDPTRAGAIRESLKQLQSTPQPHLRMNGTRGIAMLAISDLLQQAHAHPDQIELIKARLNDNSRNNLYASDESLQIAANIVFNEIEKLQNKPK